jgi:hypothetical protein
MQILNNAEWDGKHSCIVRKNIFLGLNSGLFECIISAFSWRKWREVQKTLVRLFDDPTLQPGGEGEYAPLCSNVKLYNVFIAPYPYTPQWHGV